MMPLLTGVRVLELGLYVAGPLAGRVLASQGAEVLQLTTRGGSGVLNALATDGRPTSGLADDLYACKRSLSLNLRLPQAQPVLDGLLAVSDALVANLSVEGMTRFGITWERIRRVNPQLIMVCMPGVGLSGPWSHFVTFGVGLQGFSGINAVTGETGTPPVGPSLALPDYIAGVAAAMATAAALLKRRRTGQGTLVELSQFETAVNQIGVALMQYAATGQEPERLGNRHPTAAPHNVFRCRDEPLESGGTRDAWCAIAVLDDAQWPELCRVIGASDLAEDPELAYAAGRKRRERELEQRIGVWAHERLAWEVMRSLQAGGVPAGAVESGADLLEHDTNLRERNFFRQSQISSDMPLRYHSVPLRFSHAAEAPARRPPSPGEDNRYVLEQMLGLEPVVIADLIERGVVG
jgi:crotonobetainyl-CoA:carnitine CoA-transferase CaiB-like acyl-CoA transferase